MEENNKDDLEEKLPDKKTSGDKISIDSSGDENVFAVGRFSFAVSLKLKVGDKFNLMPVVIALVAIVGILTTVIFQFRPPPECLDQMGNGFNVAVAEFQVLDSDGNTIQGPDGYDLAEFIYERIVAHYSSLELDKTTSYEIWGPKCTGIVAGSSIEERRTAAESLADDIEADVLVYGYLEDAGADSFFYPEFYIHHSTSIEGDEISGNHDFGAGVWLELPFNETREAFGNTSLEVRLAALKQITIGLVYFSYDRYEEAIEYFKKAEAIQDWDLKGEGKETIYLLLGNAYLRLSSRDMEQSYLPEAEKNYEIAKTIKPDYGRAIIGYAGTIYLNSLGDPADMTVDPEKLNEVEAILKEALELKNQPESANISTKVHFYLGQINLVRAYGQIPGEDWLALAKSEFKYVVDDYLSGDIHIINFASDAYTRLGLIDYANGDFSGAEEKINQAIEIASPFYKSQYYAVMASLYSREGMTDQAIEYYEKAIIIARSNSYSDRVEKYQDALEQIKASD